VRIKSGTRPQVTLWTLPDQNFTPRRIREISIGGTDEKKVCVGKF